MQPVIGAVAPRLSVVKWRNSVLFKGQAGFRTSSPSQGCCHIEILGVRRSPFSEFQTTTGTSSSHPRTPASAPATTSCKEPVCKTQSGQQSGWSSQGEGSGNRQALAPGHLPTKPFSPKAVQEDQEPSFGSFGAVESPCPFALPSP